MKLLLKLIFFFLLPLAVIGAPALVVIYALDGTATVKPQPKLAVEDIERARALQERYDPKNLPTDRETVITASSDDINAILNAGLAGTPALRARAAVADFGLITAITVELPQNPFGRYINIIASFPPSERGFAVSTIEIGRLTMPPGLVKPVLRTAFDMLISSGKGKLFVDSIRSVSFQGDQVAVHFQPPDRMVEEIKTAALKAATTSSPDRVRVYYEAIQERQDKLPLTGHVSLSEFVGPLFQLARQRSETHDASEENRAALLALAMYFGDPRFERFVGEVVTPEMKNRKQKTDHVRLSGHEDWVQHFTASIGLALTGGKGIADVIGQAKEVDDITHSSGFSFTDIAADRAGTRLATIAIGSDRAARRVQEALAGKITEQSFFPPVRDLPDQMSGADFKKRYGGLQSDAYKKMVAEIDQRIDRIPLYR